MCGLSGVNQSTVVEKLNTDYMVYKIFTGVMKTDSEELLGLYDIQ